MEEQILNLKNQAISSILGAKTEAELEQLRIVYLGRKGEIAKIINEFLSLSPEQKKETGRLVNDAKRAIEEALANQQSTISHQSSPIEQEWFDLTAPGKQPERGHFHPQTQVLGEILDIFRFLGYQIADGPEIETDWYNFGVLNLPPDHPARDTQQTIYLPNGSLLRTQTSAMQGRIMEKTKPPFRVLVPGKVFRYENPDASHGFEFWQIEGFAVDQNIRLTDLLGTISYVFKRLFGKKTQVKFAGSYFPFVEPGLEAYLECTACSGKGCSFCKQGGWIEILGAGMIHPLVLNQAKIDSQTYQGFAFGFGLSRIVTLRYGMDDLRLLTTPDLRILNQF